jgi:hypothetical protein
LIRSGLYAAELLSHCQPTSKENIAGTWSPAVNNTTTTTYTFTPSGSACATTAQLTVTVYSTGKHQPFDPLRTCMPSGLYDHTATKHAKENIAVPRSPAVNNTTTTTLYICYSIRICMCNNSTADCNSYSTGNTTCDPIGPVCSGLYDQLTTNHLKKIFAGTWSPAINNTQPLLIHLLHQESAVLQQHS